MFLGTTEAGEQAVLFCYDHGDEDVIPPECFRIYDITEDVWVRYTFKEPYLPEWRRIDDAVHAFVNDLMVQ